jgi:hypothetical protein
MRENIRSSVIFRCAIHFSLCCLLTSSSYLFAAVPPTIEMRIPDETVPPGGMLQLKVEITEANPISKGRQKSTFQSRFLAPVQGIALFSPDGDASGTAVLSKGTAQFSLSSPVFSMGMNVDYPILTLAIPVKPTAVPGNTVPLTLDPIAPQWLDPTGQGYPVLLTDGLLTIGGTLSISDIIPGGGVVPARTKIAILGVGFQPDAAVQVNGAILATRTYVGPNEIDVTLNADINMTSRRIRVTNRSTNERATYYSYQRTTEMGKSKHALIAATVPLFAQSTWSLAFFRPVLNGSQFSGLALENPTAQPVKVRLQLFASNGTLLKSRTVKLLPNKRFTRDLVELFIGVVPGNGTKLEVNSPVPIPMLGLLGDDAFGTVDPVAPSATP